MRKIVWMVILIFVTVGLVEAQNTPSFEEQVAARAKEIEAKAAKKKKEEDLCKAMETKIQKEACKQIKKEKEESEERTKKIQAVAAKQIKKEQERIAKRERYEAETVLSAQVTGCDPATVEVLYKPSHYNLVNHTTLNLTIVNTEDTWMIDEIREAKLGPIVRNLCPGGAMTLRFAQDWTESNEVDITLKAIARIPGGGIATEERLFKLDRSRQAYKREEGQNWQIHLVRPYSNR